MRELRISRRALLTAAAATVVAVDPAGLGWLTEADAANGIRVPGLDGELVLDDAAADDYGHIVHKRPLAVLRPGSVRDIQRMVRFANDHRLRVAMRGQGHATYGQAQVRAGIVIDSSTLATIHRIDRDRAVVDAGVQWLDLIKATLPKGTNPPVATDYLGLSVGGALSVGGIGGATSHHGLQTDNVLALEVVTGRGDLITCRPGDDVFHSVLGGLGQFAIIARATVRLVPAATTARVFHLFYPDLASFTAAQRIALADRRFSYLEGQIAPTESGWAYQLEGVAYYTPPAEPDDAALTAGLNPVGAEITDLPYFDWLNRIYDLVQELIALRLSGPWINVFLPDEAVDAYAEHVLATTSPADAGGVVLLYPVSTAVIRQPFTVLPERPVVFLLAMLRAVNAGEVPRLLAVNRDLYDKATSVGGKHYPVGAIPLSPADWRAHYGRRYGAFATAKRRYDPRNVLTPGQGIFP